MRSQVIVPDWRAEDLSGEIVFQSIFVDKWNADRFVTGMEISSSEDIFATGGTPQWWVRSYKVARVNNSILVVVYDDPDGEIKPIRWVFEEEARAKAFVDRIFVRDYIEERLRNG